MFGAHQPESLRIDSSFLIFLLSLSEALVTAGSLRFLAFSKQTTCLSPQRAAFSSRSLVFKAAAACNINPRYKQFLIKAGRANIRNGRSLPDLLRVLPGKSLPGMRPLGL